MVCMIDGPCGGVQSFTNANGTNHKAGEGTSSSGGPGPNASPGPSASSGGRTESQFARYTAMRNFIFKEMFKMMNSAQFKEILAENNAPLWQYFIGNPSANALLLWAYMVGPTRPWDFKREILNELSRMPRQDGELPEYTRFDKDPNVQLYFNIWANISYGYVGRAAGFSADELQGGAEFNAGFSQTNTGGNYVGRQIGIDLYDQYKPNQLTPQDIDNEIATNLPALKPYAEVQPFPSKHFPSSWEPSTQNPWIGPIPGPPIPVAGP